MCGITGIVSFKSNDASLAKNIHSMTNMIKHRGPNDEGYILLKNSKMTPFFGDDTINSKNENLSHMVGVQHVKKAYNLNTTLAFGHRRLSIIDLSLNGHQPMSYMNRYWMVYNGEIFNYIELRNELIQQGYNFNSNSDTEVILASYDFWGLNCQNKFNGMWAFVIYDESEKKLFISRDRFGIKPLYYYKDKDYLIFSSEIKSILAHSELNISPNITYCHEYLKEGPKEYIRETAFQKVYRFMHASYIEMTINDLKDSEIREKQFWELKTVINTEHFDNQKAIKYAEKYCEILKDAIRIRLRADVKVGSALSGGLDSSTITHLINEIHKEQNENGKLETFSNVYKSNEGVKHCDESDYINELANFLNVKSNQIEPSVNEIENEHKKMIFAMENPAVGPNMGGWYTFKLIGKSDVTINLDGQGADEQLGGYFYFLWRYFMEIPLSSIISEYRAFSKIPGVSIIKLYGCIISNLFRKILPIKFLDWILYLLSERNKENKSFFIPVNQMLVDETMSGLLNLIHFGDSQSMAHSIESRLPFMDYRLVEFLASVPAVYKIHGGWTKYLARLAMNNKLPDNITWRKDKMGWPDPTDYWFRGPLKEWLCKEVETSQFLKQLNVGSDIRKQIEKNTSISSLIWQLNLSVWHKTFFSQNEFN